MRRVLLLVLLLLSCGLATGWGQNNTLVITADHDAICVGQSVHLTASMETSSPFVIDFETGNFSQGSFNNTGSSYPWVISTGGNTPGTRCMKSNNAGQPSTSSSITLTYNFSDNGYIAFDAKCMGEGTYTFWDACRFYIDGTLMFEYGALGNTWNNYSFEVSMGTHTFKWEYSKDGSVDPTGDAFYVDNITLSNSTMVMPVSNTKTYDFESHSFQGWTAIDADGDGFNWMLGSELMPNGFTGHGESEEIVVSQSYEKYGENSGLVLFPDNYLVSPHKMAIKQGAYIRFYACAQDQAWPSEHFGVAISYGSNTNPNDFITIQEWTMTAKSEGEPEELSPEGNRVMGTWRYYNVNLNAYAGQYVWVAIRHFNCSDMFYLDVDDISIKSGNTNTSGNVLIHWDPPLNADGATVTATPNQTTTYTVMAYTYGLSFCMAQITITVYTDPGLTIVTSTGETALCNGETITLYATIPGAVETSVGDILCTDGSLVKPPEYGSSGKTAKAIVFYVDATGQHGWAVDLSQITNKKWSTETVAVPGLRAYSHWMDANSDFDGYSNTQRIRNFGSSTKYPAAYAVNISQGWYLPAIGQLNVLFGALNAINRSLSLVGGTPIPYGNGSELWSSSTSSLVNYSMLLAPNLERVTFANKTSSYNVRPIINF